MDKHLKLRVILTSALVIVSAWSYSVAQLPAIANKPGAAVRSTPAQDLTEADIAKLRWIVGSWKGTGGGATPFYERYSFRDGRTLAVESFDDDSLSKVTETAFFKLENGSFSNGSYALSGITDDSARFVPIVPSVRNTFVWQREREGAWKAILTWPASASKPGGERIYSMTRLEERQ